MNDKSALPQIGSLVKVSPKKHHKDTIDYYGLGIVIGFLLTDVNNVKVHWFGLASKGYGPKSSKNWSSQIELEVISL